MAEVPASKRCEVEGVAASPARFAASASRGMPILWQMSHLWLLRLCKFQFLILLADTWTLVWCIRELSRSFSFQEE